MIALARHGETEYNAALRFQGQLPVGLSELGRTQAVELARMAAGRGPWARLYSSSLLRARQTAEVVGRAIGLDPIEDARFDEADSGDWSGRLFSEVEQSDPERFADYIGARPDFAFPGGESFAQQADRVLAGVEAVRAGDTPALVVCHRGSIRLALAALGGDEAARTQAVENGSLVELP